MAEEGIDVDGIRSVSPRRGLLMILLLFTGLTPCALCGRPAGALAIFLLRSIDKSVDGATANPSAGQSGVVYVRLHAHRRFPSCEPAKRAMAHSPVRSTMKTKSDLMSLGFSSGTKWSPEQMKQSPERERGVPLLPSQQRGNGTIWHPDHREGNPKDNPGRREGNVTDHAPICLRQRESRRSGTKRKRRGEGEG